MSSFGLIEKNMELSHIYLAVQHQGEIQQEYSPGNIDRTYGDSSGQPFYPFDPPTNSKNLRRSGATLLMIPDGSDSDKWESLSFNGLLNHMAYTFFEGILAVIVGTLMAGLGFSLIGDFFKKGISEPSSEGEKRMFKGIEDAAIANIMTSIDEFKTKYLN